jgi:hypothetical protein
MPAYNAVAILFDVLLAFGTVVALYWLLRRSLAAVLDDLIGIPAATEFFLRTLLLVLLCIALKEIVPGIRQKPEAAFMEYVWNVAAHLGEVLDEVYAALLIFLAYITVLVAVLRRRHVA